MLVCGCGTSAGGVLALAGLPSIGVNDIGRLFTPTYLVVVNPPRQFRGDRFGFVRDSRAQALFTQLDLGPVNPPVVRFRLGRYGGTDIGSDSGTDDTLHYTQNSPYVAVCLAAYMGAKRIGLIGVDFTDHHFFADTGRHPLASRLPAIDREYAALAAGLAARGVELVNLSPISRLTSLPRLRTEDFAPALMAAPRAARPALQAVPRARRVFVVNYHFQTCGDVFADGLRHAAARIGVDHAEAAWDDARLPERVDRFDPDLLLVVHGRRFVQRWGTRFEQRRSAVWLVDEPYEVDNTAAWSRHFDTVFVNDPATLTRHLHAQFLPMAYDPEICCDSSEARPHAVGFIGGPNPTRERFLMRLADVGLLNYVVGGPWRAPALRRLALAAQLPHEQTAALYRQTRIVINVFRDRHHFNAAGTPAQAMNPRIYEALACGALVVSERRAEIGQVFPELPQFDTPEEAVLLVQRLLADEAEQQRLLAACRARLTGHTYADRLALALALTCGAAVDADADADAPCAGPGAAPPAEPLPLSVPAPTTWRPTLSLVPTQMVQAASARAPLALRPFDRMPRRHLMYHLWPVRGGTWRWNVEQLLQRVELFNGRRLLGIVSDARTEELSDVHAAFAGHGFEFIELPNDARGEAATFPLMLERLADEPRGDVSFYAHAKGVKYEPQFPPAVRRWAEVQYTAALDHWPAVREQLERFAMTGLLRRTGRFANHSRIGDWHYSGTFFWFRHDAVFSRPWREVPQFYGGVEAWPGVMFAREEAGCLLLDGLRELPYHDRFWTQRGNPAFAQWKATQRPLPVPADLAQPLPFDGVLAPRLEQHPAEFGWWLQQLLDARVRRLLMIGAGHGGEEWHVARRFREAGLDIEITTCAASPRPAWLAAVADAQARYSQVLRRVDDARAALPVGIDAAFIDGDHGYRSGAGDVALSQSLGARLIGLHDIVDSDWHAQARCAVSRVWAGLKATHRTEERSGGRWGGIGLAKGLR